MLELNLIVNLPSRAPYAAKHRSLVPRMLLGRVTSGVLLAVKVDPADPQKLVVDWEDTGFGIQMAAGQQTSGIQKRTGVDESSRGQDLI